MATKWIKARETMQRRAGRDPFWARVRRPEPTSSCSSSTTYRVVVSGLHFILSASHWVQGIKAPREKTLESKLTKAARMCSVSCDDTAV